MKISETGKTHLPLGFKKICLVKIPPFAIKAKLLVYNEKYKSHTMESAGSPKPISKILK
jgi:hypothetical protein